MGFNRNKIGLPFGYRRVRINYYGIGQDALYQQQKNYSPLINPGMY